MRALAPFALASFLLAVLAGCGGLRIDAVTPGTTAPGGHIVVEGAGFSEGLALLLEQDGTQVQLQNLEVVDSARAEADVPGAAPNGRFDVVATQGGAEARKSDALSVVADALRVHFLDVGQGDATLVVAPSGEALLIDGGPRDAEPVVKDAITRLARGRLDAVVLSHTDADHLGALVELLQGDDNVPGTQDDLTPLYAASYFDDGACDSGLCGDARDLRAWPFAIAAVGDRVPLGDPDDGGALVEIVASDGDVGAGRLAGIDADNERSVVVRVSFGGRTVLITGDLTGGGLGDADLELPLASRVGRVDVLRLSHHGSATSSRLASLEAFGPRAVVVSLGTDNAYCHPAPEVTAALTALGAPVFATGAGIVEDAARCDQATTWPQGARVGQGTLTLEVAADGAMTLGGAPL
jgi:competence protein ComEC